MRNMVGVDADFDCLLDPQQAKPAGFCERCGGEIYTAGERLCCDCREVE